MAVFPFRQGIGNIRKIRLLALIDHAVVQPWRTSHTRQAALKMEKAPAPRMMFGTL
jgi:hypothetical protein